MSKYTCEKCGKEFSYKTVYIKHQNQKRPCKKVISEINEIVEKVVEEKLKELKIENKVDKTLSKNIISLKPIIKWSGGKTDEIKYIIKHLPDTYSIYLEPFIGGGALYFYLNPVKSVINDVHKELIDFYQSIKDGYSTEIYEYMKEHSNNEETYYKVRSYNVKNSLDNAKRFYYLRKTCFRGMLRYNSKGEFNIPYGRYKTYNYEDVKNKYYEDLLKRTDIYNESFEYIFEKYNDENNFMFLDPPYDSEFTDYGYCSFGKEEHIKLADYFKKTKIKCLMVIGKTTFIQDLYKEYIVEEYDKKYKFKLHSGRIGNEINTSHLVIKNY
jgi:DNA adenine methylase